MRPIHSTLRSYRDSQRPATAPVRRPGSIAPACVCSRDIVRKHDPGMLFNSARLDRHVDPRSLEPLGHVGQRHEATAVWRRA